MDITYQLMIPLLQQIAKACHSYGWAIVLLTLMVRVILYPLVASSTRSMQRMSQLQPQIKEMQDRYKSDPELFQKKAMEFYQKNKINPVGGCLPMLIQLPILFALFSTFTGPPFGDKLIPVKIHVVAASDSAHVSKAGCSQANSAYVSENGQLAKLVVFPGDSTVTSGSTIDFGIRPIDGAVSGDFVTGWKITGNAHGAIIDKSGRAEFPDMGEVNVQAVIPGVAKNERFGFISNLGKVAKGMDLFKRENWDNVALIILFGVTMWLSQKLMVQPTSLSADSEQAKIQKQTQQIMPFTVTGMFFFVPLPSGVFLYMVVSNLMQAVQTWFIMRSPAPAVVLLSDEKTGSNTRAINSTENGGKQKSGKKKSKRKK
jgi:YidC/Oxa1 family membrane protein insertase